MGKYQHQYFLVNFWWISMAGSHWLTLMLPIYSLCNNTHELTVLVFISQHHMGDVHTCTYCILIYYIFFNSSSSWAHELKLACYNGMTMFCTAVNNTIKAASSMLKYQELKIKTYFTLENYMLHRIMVCHSQWQAVSPQLQSEKQHHVLSDHGDTSVSKLQIVWVFC